MLATMVNGPSSVEVGEDAVVEVDHAVAEVDHAAVVVEADHAAVVAEADHEVDHAAAVGSQGEYEDGEEARLF